MAINTKKPFVYTQEHKAYGTNASTASLLPNNGFTSIVGDSTFILAAPRPGSLVTLYRASTNSTANVVIVSTSSSGQAAFNSLGGTQKLILQPTTVGGGEDASVMLFGEATTQWRIVNCWPRLAADSTTNGVRVTT